MKYPIRILLILLVMYKGASCLKCFQCSTTSNKGCWPQNLNNSYLQECITISNRPIPICRVLSQAHYFTLSQDIIIIRECAYVYERPLRCIQSKFSGLHYSLSCDCEEDACNKARPRLDLSVVWLISFIRMYF